MEIVEYGLARVLAPHVEDDDLRVVDDLAEVGSLADFEYADRSVRHLVVTDGILSGGKLTRIEAQRATFDRATFHSMILQHCVLTSSDWIDCALSRVIFRDCKILGANFVANTWSNVVFDSCRLEYTTFESIRASAPAVFIGTRLKDVTFRGVDLPGGHMSDCTLDAVEFDGGTYRDFDLRGNDLSTVRGASNLRGIVIDVPQRHELAEALVSELDLQYPELDS